MPDLHKGSASVLHADGRGPIPLLGTKEVHVKVGDRVRVVPDKYGVKKEFVGKLGTIVAEHISLYEQRTIYDLQLDEPFEIPDYLKGKFAATAYGIRFWPEELEVVDIPAPPPPPPKPKRKWWQWGS